MKIRAVLTVLTCNVMAVVLTSLAGFLVVRFAPWGRWAVDFHRLPPTKLAAQYGDPVALLQRGVLYHTWLIAPLIALVVGAAAGAMLRRCDWRVGTLGVPLLIVVFATPTSLTRALAACLYIVASWSGMKLMSLWLGPSASSPGRRSHAEGGWSGPLALRRLAAANAINVLVHVKAAALSKRAGADPVLWGLASGTSITLTGGA